MKTWYHADDKGTIRTIPTDDADAMSFSLAEWPGWKESPEAALEYRELKLNYAVSIAEDNLARARRRQNAFIEAKAKANQS